MIAETPSAETGSGPHVSGERLKSLRAKMRGESWDAVVIPTGDPHISEYPLAKWSSRAWFSGFTGSAGTLAVTRKEAALWTDGRYAIQSAQQLDGSGIVPVITGKPGSPKLADWLVSRIPAGGTAVCDGHQISAESARKIISKLSEKNICLKLNADPADGIWTERPELPAGKVFIHRIEFAGESAADKIARIRKIMRDESVSHCLISSLDSVAWTLNVRGSDIPCTPVAAAFLLLSAKNAVCFINKQKCSAQILAHFKDSGVTVKPYDSIETAVKSLPAGKSLLADPAKTSAWLMDAVPESVEIIGDPDPAEELKAVKNTTEINSLRRRADSDSSKTARFLAWFDLSVKNGETITELSASAKIEKLRGEDPEYLGPGFTTIAAYGKHAAVVHYSPDAASDAAVRPRGLFLVDTGGQYQDGTTDITRTVSCGKLTQDEKNAYTLVLKAHIALASAVFPAGTTGQQIDILARRPLAAAGEGYAHGTGHGVGFCLCVHEGPQSIRSGGEGVPLQPGMIVTDEPGIYHKDKFGVRTENMLLVVEKRETSAGRFLAFEPLLHCPVDLRPVIPGRLSRDEISWLNAYHRETRKRLMPLMRTAYERAWLNAACKPLAAHG